MFIGGREMLRNSGGKIKVIAAIICLLGTLISIIITVNCFSNAAAISNGRYEMSSFLLIVGMLTSGIEDPETAIVLYGFMCLIIGLLISWSLGFLVYGFGEIVENSAETAYNTRCMRDKVLNARQESEYNNTNQNFNPNLNQTSIPTSNEYIQVKCPMCQQNVTMRA